MEQQIKFTNDGKKVVVVGKLNNTETIVQEIFIVNGNEIPSGENFVVKSLHDAPAKSWKETELEKLEARFQSEKKRIEYETKRWKDAERNIIPLVRDKVSYMKKFATEKAHPVLETVESFLCGDIKYLVHSNYDPYIQEFSEQRIKCDYDHDKIKLLTLFGNDDGTLGYAINKYKDGSGYNEHDIFPCKTMEDATEKLKEVMLVSIKRYGLNETKIKTCREYGITIDENALQEFKEKRIRAVEKNIADYQKNIEEQIAHLERVKSIWHVTENRNAEGG